MTFDDACDIKIPSGKYRGRTIYQVAGSGDGIEGLRYLDWLRGCLWFEEGYPEISQAVGVFLEYPPVARKLQDVRDERREGTDADAR